MRIPRKCGAACVKLRIFASSIFAAFIFASLVCAFLILSVPAAAHPQSDARPNAQPEARDSDQHEHHEPPEQKATPKTTQKPETKNAGDQHPPEHQHAKEGDKSMPGMQDHNMQDHDMH